MQEFLREEQISKARKTLFETIDKLAAHMKTDHDGTMATTCHTCMSYKLIIDDNEMFIKERERDIADSE